MGDARLGPGVEDGVAATGISPDRVGFANAVADGNAVSVTGASASEVVLTLRKEGGKDAVLHMKHRDVLMEGELKPFRRGGAKEFEDLADVQVVARRERAKAFGNK